jgi:hypothetical protein
MLSETVSEADRQTAMRREKKKRALPHVYLKQKRMSAYLGFLHAKHVKRGGYRTTAGPAICTAIICGD